MSDQSLEQFATSVVAKLREVGHVAYFAGGCVRDRLLAVAPKDFDVATSARPEQVRELFGKRRTIAIGASFGVITVLGRKPHQVEVATFRSDGNYSDGRRPDQVTYSSPEHDAERRDFTINGMFFDPLERRVIDFVGGQEDLRRRCVRAIGDPEQRIAEDRLRMLRAVRFAATYDFSIESTTLLAVQQHHAQIGQVSQERITHELQRMLVHANRRYAMQLLHQSHLLSVLFPQLASLRSHTPTSWDRLRAILQQLNQSAERPGFALVLSILLGRDGEALSEKEADRRCREMKVSNEIRNATRWLVQHESGLDGAAAMSNSQLHAVLTGVAPAELVQTKHATATVEDAGQDGAKLRDWQAARDWMAQPSEQRDPAPLVGGQDIIGLGVRPGPNIAAMLAWVRQQQLDGQLTCKDAAIESLRAEIAAGRW